MYKFTRQQKAGLLYRTSLLYLFFLISSLTLQAQTVYDNFEGQKSIWYFQKTGVLDTVAKNPASNAINKSEKCALYVRNTSKKFDNIKMGLKSKLSDVNLYSTYEGQPPRLHLKVYTTAPVGTLVEILLGSKGRNTEYPAGTHSQYQAYTKKTGEWEDLEFLFSQIPEGSETSADQIDQMTLLFYPNSQNSDTYYFDELSGPALLQAKENTVSKPNTQSIKK